jgi:hypothetical protein
LFLIAVELKWVSEKAVLKDLPDLVLNRKNTTKDVARLWQGDTCLKKVFSLGEPFVETHILPLEEGSKNPS